MGIVDQTPWAKCMGSLAGSCTTVLQAKQRQRGRDALGAALANVPQLSSLWKASFFHLWAMIKKLLWGKCWLCLSPPSTLQHPWRRQLLWGGQPGCWAFALAPALGKSQLEAFPIPGGCHNHTLFPVAPCRLAALGKCQMWESGSLRLEWKLPNIFGRLPALCKPSANSDKGWPCSLRARPGLYKPSMCLGWAFSILWSSCPLPTSLGVKGWRWGPLLRRLVFKGEEPIGNVDIQRQWGQDPPMHREAEGAWVWICEQTQCLVLFELEVTAVVPKTPLGLQQMMVLKAQLGKDGECCLARRGRKGWVWGFILNRNEI